jgi:hypothetical protein
VHDQAALAARQPLGESRGQDRRGRAGQHGAARRQRIEGGEDRPLQLQVFGRVFLDVVGAGQRRSEIPLDADQRLDGFRILSSQEVALGQVRQHGPGEFHGRFRRRRVLVPQSHLVAGPGEGDGPAPADEAGADDGHLSHVRPRFVPCPGPVADSTVSVNPIPQRAAHSVGSRSRAVKRKLPRATIAAMARSCRAVASERDGPERAREDLS